MGGEKRDLVTFQLEWHTLPELLSLELHRAGQSLSLNWEENPHLARTVDEAVTDSPSRRETRIHTPGQGLRMRYARFDKLGSGQFGEVYKAVDVDSGRLMAVKIIRPHMSPTKEELDEWRLAVKYALKREVETLSRLNHVSKRPNAAIQTK